MMQGVPERSEETFGRQRGSLEVWSLAVGLGLTSIVAQFVLLREFLAAFGGNELIVGIVLANWMVLTGIGAFLGRKRGGSRRALGARGGLLLVLGVLPLATVFALRTLRNVMFTAGSMIGIVEVLASSFVLLVPSCLLSGFGFALLLSGFGIGREDDSAAKVYSWESLGSAAGGIVFNVVLITFFDSFQVLTILCLLDAGLVLFLARGKSLRILRLAGWCVAISVLAVMFFGGPDAYSRGRLFPGQELMYSRDTPYGALAVTRQGDQLNFFENGVLLSSTNEVTTREESVHYALAQCRSPRRVLMIGGGASGSVQEVLKYGVERVDEVEINPWIIGVVRRYAAAPDDPRVQVINEDARFYVDRTEARYDAVLVNLPDPSTAQLNRCYTLEFFQRVRAILTNDGVVSASLLPGAEYQGGAARLLGSALLTTLQRVFPHVLVIPGERHFFLASNDSLDIGIARLVERRMIPTLYVNRFYIDDELLAQRSREVMSTFAGGGVVNSDYRPLCYSLQLDYWLASLGFSVGWVVVPVAVLFILIFWRSSPVGAGIFAGGTAASSLEVVLLLSFQVFCGSLYQMTGIVVTAFMVGLAVGSGPVARVMRRRGMRRFIVLQVAFAAVCFLLPAMLSLLRAGALPLPALYAVFISATFGVALLTGLEFAVGLSAQAGTRTSAASGLYGLDLLGSAAGALVVSVYALPEFGIMAVSMIAGAICIAGAARCSLAQLRIS